MQHRTALLTAGSTVSVVLAAMAALVVNVGIFDRASSAEVGQLTAVDFETTTTDADIRAVSAPAPTGTQVIEVAGIATVSVSVTTDPAGSGADQLSVDGVEPEPGWGWDVARLATDATEITFTDGQDVQIVTLTSAHGQISARLRSATPAPTVTAAPTSGHTDDDEHEDDEHEDEEHEGGEDDD